MSGPLDLDALGRLTPWDGVRAVVAGIGVSGFAAADNLTHLGARVTVLAEAANDAQREKADAAGDARRRGPPRRGRDP